MGHVEKITGLAGSGDGLDRMVLSLLGCATRSIQDFVRKELRTVLAISFGERSEKTL